MDPASSLSLINSKNHLEVDPLLAFEWFVYTHISQVHTELLQWAYLLNTFIGLLFF